LHSGPSEETVAAIRRTFDLVRHDRKRVSAFAIIALLLGVLAVAATVFGISAFLERNIALKNEGISLAALCFA
jgi:hypothetical protein